MLAGVVIEGGAALHGSIGDWLRDLAPWLALGFVEGPDIGGFHDTRVLLARVTWTLHWEWLFYLSLPVSAVLARRGRLHLPAIGLLLAATLIRQAVHPAVPALNHPLPFVTLFLTGMFCASLHAEGLTKRRSDTWSSAAVLTLLTIVALAQQGSTAGSTILLGLIFYLIVSGTTVFGLLVSRPAVRLGDISYGIYLLQGLALAALLRPEPLREIATGSALGHWVMVFLSSVLLVAVATLAHDRIERPGIALGKRLAAALATRRQRFVTTTA